MSTLLHLETDNVEACASQLREKSEAIRLQAQALASAARSLDWYGPNRDMFQFEMEQIARALTVLADEGQVLAARVEREASEWQQTDDYYAGQFSQIIIPNFRKG